MTKVIELGRSSNFDGKPSLHPERKGQLNRSPLKNWVEKNGGLPTYINSIATALLRENPTWSISRVIATAVNAVKKMCSTGRAFGGKTKVSKAVQTAACGAVASWERKKVKASADFIDNNIIKLASEEGAEIDELWVLRAKKRLEARENGKTITDSIALSDEEFINYAIVDLSDDWGEGVNMDADKWIELMELSAADEMSLRLPVYELGGTAATAVGGNIFEKEIWRVGDINYKGRKVRFTPEMLKEAYRNFKKGTLDYIPFQFLHKSVNGEDHPKDYAGRITELSLDDEENPTKMMARFDVTEEARKIIEHNPRFGVSVKVHPNFTDPSTGEYYGTQLLHVAGTHYPRLREMDEWKSIAASTDPDGETIDLSDGEFDAVEASTNETVTEGGTMSEKKTEETQALTLDAIMGSDAFKEALRLGVEEQTKALKEENEALRGNVATIRKESYENTVKGAVNRYREAGVPPVMLDMAEAMLLSFDQETRNETVELSYGTEDEQKTESLNRVQMVTKMLDEAKGFIDLGAERGSGEEDETTTSLSADEADKAAEYLAGIAS